MADTLPVDTGSAAVADLNPIARLDVPLAQLDADLQFLRLKREAAAQEARIRDGIRGEYGHILHDADPNAATKPFPDLCKGTPARLIDGGQS